MTLNVVWILGGVLEQKLGNVNKVSALVTSVVSMFV